MRERILRAEDETGARRDVERAHFRTPQILTVREVSQSLDLDDSAALMEYARGLRAAYHNGRGIEGALKDLPEATRAALRGLFAVSDDYWLSKAIAGLDRF